MICWEQENKIVFINFIVAISSSVLFLFNSETTVFSDFWIDAIVRKITKTYSALIWSEETDFKNAIKIFFVEIKDYLRFGHKGSVICFDE